MGVRTRIAAASMAATVGFSGAAHAACVVGEVSMFLGSYAPVGWHFLRGQELEIANWRDLYAVVGSHYGGDGNKTFRLPDMRGRVAVNAGRGPGLDSIQTGQKFGDRFLQPRTVQVPGGNGAATTVASATPVAVAPPSFGINYMVCAIGQRPTVGENYPQE